MGKTLFIGKRVVCFLSWDIEMKYVHFSKLFSEGTHVSRDVFTYLKRRVEWEAPELYFFYYYKAFRYQCIWVFNIFSNAVNIYCNLCSYIYVYLLKCKKKFHRFFSNTCAKYMCSSKLL